MLGSFWSHSCTGHVDSLERSAQGQTSHSIWERVWYSNWSFCNMKQPRKSSLCQNQPKIPWIWYFSETFKCDLKNSAELQALSKAALLPFIGRIPSFHMDPFNFLSSSEHPREEPELWDLCSVNTFKSFVAFNSLGWSFYISSFWRKSEYR